VTGVRYAFYADGTDLWRDLSIELQERFGAEPAIWLGHPRHIEFASRRFPSCEVLDERDLNIGLFGRSTRPSAPHDVLGSPAFLRCQSAAVYSLQRNAIHRDIDYLDRLVFVSGLTDFLWDRVRRSGATHFVAAQAPHSAAGFLLTGLFDALGIEMLHFDQAKIGPFMFPRLGLDYRAVSIDEVDASESGLLTPDIAKAWVDKFHQQVVGRRLAAVEERKSKIESGTSGARGLARKLINAENELRRQESPTRSSRVSLRSGLRGPGSVGRAVRSVHRRSQLISELRHAHDGAANPLGARAGFALFQLHFEPEKSTIPDGGLNLSQLAAIRIARESLPSDTELVVKEHPSQLSYVSHGFTGRSPSFYEALLGIPGVSLVSRSAPNWDLIERSCVVLTVTGTVAVEAAFVGIPSGHFGHPWYRGLNGSRALQDARTAPDVLREALEQRPAGGAATADDLVSLLARSAVLGVVSPGRLRHFERHGWEQVHDVNSVAMVVASHLGLG